MAWFFGQSLLFVVIAFLLGVLVGYLIWGRLLFGRRAESTVEPAAAPSLAESKTEVLTGAALSESPTQALTVEPTPVTAETSPAAASGVPAAAPSPETTPPAPPVEAVAEPDADFAGEPVAEAELVEPEPVDEAETPFATEPIVDAELVDEPEPAIEAEPAVESAPVTETEPVAEVEPIDSAGPVVDAEPVAGVEPVDEVEPIDSVEPVADAEPVGEVEPVADAESDAALAESPTQVIADLPQDDLHRIEGIGPKMAAALHAAGIRTYADLADADRATVQRAISQAGLNFAPSLPTWSRQARLLADGDEAGFAELTRRLIAGREISAPLDSAMDPGALTADPATPDETTLHEATPDETALHETALHETTADETALHEATPDEATLHETTPDEASTDPATSEASTHIETAPTLDADTDTAAGDENDLLGFRTEPDPAVNIDASTGAAADGDATSSAAEPEPKLAADPKPAIEPEPEAAIDAEHTVAIPVTDADPTVVIPAQGGSVDAEPNGSVEPLVAAADEDPEAEDDLQRIEGIGPQMSRALRAAGIRTYRKVAAADNDTIRAAIEAAGLRFAPSLVTWARQAALLAVGDEAGLADLQRRLVAGRDVGRV